ncbi:MAG TPA: DUF562 domain-containing protein, partial [Chlamydiales bacterium]|nr:DUF562 domain-containing protein [Chlamydiales bacterium]
FAHWSGSWARFIDFVAVHEKKKDVVIVANQEGEFEKNTTKQFYDKLFTFKRLKLLKHYGYGTIVVKGANGEEFIVKTIPQPNERTLTVIVRPSFLPYDMKMLQLAAERLLATGDNTAAEAWAARCKLYQYENVSNCGCKTTFLAQQVALAKTVSLSLARFIEIAGQSSRHELPEADLFEAIALVESDGFSKATQEFCRVIAQNYSFKPVLEGALKRAAWMHTLPELMKEEAEALDPVFTKALMTSFVDESVRPPTQVPTDYAPLLARVNSRVQEHLAKG